MVYGPVNFKKVCGLGGPNVITLALYIWVLEVRERERCQWGMFLPAWKKANSLLWTADGNHMARNCRHLQMLREAHNIASRRTGTSALLLQGTEFFQQPKWAWKLIFEQSIQKGRQPCPHLHYNFTSPWAENQLYCAWTSDLQGCELINGCCFQSVTFW